MTCSDGRSARGVSLPRDRGPLELSGPAAIPLTRAETIGQTWPAPIIPKAHLRRSAETFESGEIFYKVGDGRSAFGVAVIRVAISPARVTYSAGRMVRRSATRDFSARSSATASVQGRAREPSSFLVGIRRGTCRAAPRVPRAVVGATRRRRVQPRQCPEARGRESLGDSCQHLRGTLPIGF